MKIAILNEDLKSAISLKRLIYNFSNTKKIEVVVNIFTSYDQIIMLEKDFSLLFISLNSENGIKAARHFSRLNRKIPLIITSNDCRHAATAFKFGANNFLKFPLDEKNLYNVLNSFFDTYFLCLLMLKNGCESICVNTDEILYIEADNKNCIIHLANKTVHCKKTMARVMTALPENLFLKINRSFVVNSNYVTSFNSKIITLQNGTVLYPSRHFYNDFKFNFLQTKKPIII